ncbi:hypothetical protein BCR34DRAFT_578595 [Clohesyomyces aquaticus]|uniref:Secreted protein n=1 Tax=Clohesyomyces aquaticus TaxID=1231657 RepID=A0A1Y1YG04_9PLEO|nr:hypothetical protein BCR34DRAFT_578595 [Clohesyomyces aquaticus]
MGTVGSRGNRLIAGWWARALLLRAGLVTAAELGTCHECSIEIGHELCHHPLLGLPAPCGVRITIAISGGVDDWSWDSAAGRVVIAKSKSLSRCPRAAMCTERQEALIFLHSKGTGSIVEIYKVRRVFRRVQPGFQRR